MKNPASTFGSQVISAFDADAGKSAVYRILRYGSFPVKQTPAGRGLCVVRTGGRRSYNEAPAIWYFARE